MASSKARKKRAGKNRPGTTRARSGAPTIGKRTSATRAAKPGALIVQFAPAETPSATPSLPKRGVVPKGVSRGPAAASPAKTVRGVPRACVIEGDSWFNYPLPGAVGIDEALRRYHGYTFVRRRFSEAGDTLENMVLGPSWTDVKAAIAESGTRVLLFSGGGNDLAGPEFIGFLHHRELSSTPISEESFAALLRRSFEPCIRRMSAEVDAVSPATKIFMHGYAHAIPNGRFINLIVRRIGPWMKPSFDMKRWPLEPARQGVARLIDMYNELLARLENELPNFVYVDLRDSVGPGEWANELHPNDTGFRRCADRIHESVSEAVSGW